MPLALGSGLGGEAAQGDGKVEGGRGGSRATFGRHWKPPHSLPVWECSRVGVLWKWGLCEPVLPERAAEFKAAET